MNIHIHTAVSRKVVGAKLNKELAAGRIVGPYVLLLWELFPRNPSEFRFIHHLSYPCGASINDFIPKELSTVRYATIVKKLEIGWRLLRNWMEVVIWPKQTFSRPFVPFQFTRKIIIYSACVGRGVIILRDVPHGFNFLSLFVRKVFNGLRVDRSPCFSPVLRYSCARRFFVYYSISDTMSE